LNQLPTVQCKLKKHSYFFQFLFLASLSCWNVPKHALQQHSVPRRPNNIASLVHQVQNVLLLMLFTFAFV